MKSTIFHVFVSFLFFSLSFPTIGETWGNLIERDGRYYKKFSDSPFIGYVEGPDLRGSTLPSLIVDGQFSEGLKTGSWLFSYGDGQLNRKGVFKKGLRQGEWLSYYPNGQLNNKRYYESGLLEGAYFTYSEEGQILVEGQYLSNKRDGIWKIYYLDGVVESKGRYQLGLEVGEWKFFHENGALHETGWYENGKRVGPDDRRWYLLPVLLDDHGTD